MEQTEQIKILLEEKLPNTQVFINGEGCGLQLNLISDELAALSAVKRQQQVYTHLNPLIADGSVHAVTMAFFTHAAWAKRS